MSEWWRNIEARTTRYDLGPVPELAEKITTDERIERYPSSFSRYRIEVYDRGSGWGVFNSSMCLNKSGNWVWISPNGEVTDEWIAEHRWQDPQEAIAFYKAWLVEFMEKELAAQRAKESEEC